MNGDRNATKFKMGYEDSVYLAKLAEQAERYEGSSVVSTSSDRPSTLSGHC